MKIDSNGTVATTSNIDCGGGIALTGSNAFYYYADNTDTDNKTNTYINFKDAGANSDWCYIKQIGGSNTCKLALDFNDDGNDARFCMRNVQSTNTPDSITEVFAADNGNTSCTGTISAASTIYANGDD